MFKEWSADTEEENSIDSILTGLDKRISDLTLERSTGELDILYLSGLFLREIAVREERRWHRKMHVWNAL